MIKKFMIGMLSVFSICYMATAIVQAQPLTAHKSIDYAQKDKRTEKKMDEIPDQVQDAFNDSDYATLELNKIYEVVKQEDSDLIKKGDTFYEFVVLNGPEKWAVQYSKVGKFIDAHKLDTHD